MPTLEEYEQSRKWETKGAIAVRDIEGALIAALPSVLTVSGSGFDADTVAAFGEEEVIENIYKSYYELEIPWTPNKSGQVSLTLSNGDRRSEPFSLTVNNPASNSKLNNEGWLMLGQEEELDIVDDDTEADIRHRKNIPVIRAESGIYLDKGGYIAFPGLGWDRSTRKTAEFLFDWAANRNVYFGIASQENFNFASTDKNSTEMCLYLLRNRVSYFYGGQYKGSYRQDIQIPSGRYRLAIASNGSPGGMVEMYLREEEERLVYRAYVPNSIRGIGETLMPVMLGGNKNKSLLLGVRVSHVYS